MNKKKLIEAFEKHNPRTPMTEDETKIMMTLMMSKNIQFSTPIDELDKESEIYKHFKPLIDSFQGQVFLKRLQTFTSLKMTLGAFVILMQYISSLGACVMYTFYLHTKLPKNTVVTVETFADVFPWGFFSKQQLSDIWSAQKIGTENQKGHQCVGAPDNMIDYLEIWK